MRKPNPSAARKLAAACLAIFSGTALMLSAGCNSAPPAWAMDQPTAVAASTAILPWTDSTAYHPDSLHIPTSAPVLALASSKLTDEVWIIEAPAPAAGAEELPPCMGVLTVKRGNENGTPLNTRELTVRPVIKATVATITIAQDFLNPRNEVVEGEYALTLPKNATPTDFVLAVGDRRILAMVRDKASAEKLFDAAKAHGLPTTVSRSGTPVSLQLGNIQPGKNVSISITYVQPLTVKNGMCVLALGGWPKEIRKRTDAGDKKVNLAAVVPGDEGSLYPGVNLDLTMDAGMKLEKIASELPLAPLDENKPYHVAYKTWAPFSVGFGLSGKEPKAALLIHRDRRGAFFGISIVAPLDQPATGLILTSKELGEVRLPDVPKGSSLLLVGLLDAGRVPTEPPTLVWDKKHSIPMMQLECDRLPYLWARAQHDALPATAAKDRMHIALENGLLTDETAILTVDTAPR